MRNPKKSMWVVMKAAAFSDCTFAGVNLEVSEKSKGPHKFLPVFKTKTQAIKWAGTAECVFELQEVLNN